MFFLKEIPFQINNEFSNTHITNVSIDGRSISNNGLYIPIKGENNDGHAYIHQAIENGAIASLWNKETEIPDNLPASFCLIFVDSTLEALHHLSKFYLHKVGPKVIGITGSVGKTTAKDICFALLKKKYMTHKTSGNLNNHYGLPLTILSMPLQTEVCVLEMGMSGIGEISELSLLANPDYAIVTCIGESHLAQLGSRENIAKAKLEILQGLKNNEQFYFDGDEPLLRNNAGVSIGFHSGEHKLNIVNRSNHSTTFELDEDTYEIPLIGDHHAKNAAYGILIAKSLGVNQSEITDNLLEIEFSKMRMEYSEGINNAVLINDTYNASPLSMKGAITSISKITGYTKRILVLGDMFELGDEEKTLHESVASAISESISHVFLIGPKAAWIGEEIERKHRSISVSYHTDSIDAAKSIAPILDKNTVLLAKASRGMRLDTVIDSLKSGNV